MKIEPYTPPARAINLNLADAPDGAMAVAQELLSAQLAEAKADEECAHAQEELADAKERVRLAMIKFRNFGRKTRKARGT